MKGINIKNKIYLLPDIALFFTLLFVLFLISLVCFCNIYPEGDVMEHIKASFKVYKGEVPYRDFFEHHHPLLWYLMGWFVALFEGMGNIIVYIADYVTFLFFLIGVFYIYKIMNEFICGRTGALLSALFILCPGTMLYYIYFKPDNYVTTCISAGLYYFFRYIRDIKRRDLVVSYFLFWLAFMFLQKAILFYPAIGVVSLFFLYKKEIMYKDFLISLIAPVLFSIVFIYIWVHLGIFELYWKTNFVFNTYMREYMGEYGINKAWHLADIFFYVASFSLLILFCSMNKYYRIMGIVFASQLMFNLFYFSPHVYYYYVPFYFAVPVAVAGVLKISENNKMLKIVVIIQSIIYFLYGAYWFVHDIKVSYANLSHAYDREDYLKNLVNKCDYTFTPYDFVYNKDLGYYWFLLGQSDVIGDKVGIRPIEDINKLIEDKKPKLIYVQNIYERYEKVKGNKVIVHKFDMDMINKFYDRVKDNVLFDELLEMEDFSETYSERAIKYLLKPEFRKDNCKYNPKTRKFEYEQN